jgi:phage-related tail fiber protein
MNKDWIASAATASPQADAAPAFDATAELAKLSDAEKTNFLARLLADEPALSATFTRFLENKNPIKANKTNNNRRSLAVIEAGVANAIKARTQKEKAAAAAALKKRCDDLAKREAQAWKDVSGFCDRQVGSSYDLAVKLLLSLKELAIYRNTTNEFIPKLNAIIEKYSKSKALLQRLQKAGFVVK